MGETTILEDLQLIVAGATDTQLAEHASDAGLVGTLVRAELEERGHQVSYSNINGVQSASVALTGGTEDSDPVAERVEAETGEVPVEEAPAEPEAAAPEQDGTPAQESAAEGE